MKKRVFFLFLLGFALSCYLMACHGLSNTKVCLDIDAKPAEYLSNYHFFLGEMKKLNPNQRVIPYELNSTLFTDYAFKSRFIFIPEDKYADYQTEHVLQLPVGCCIIKNFYYPDDFRKPEGKRRIIETRLLIHKEKGWEASEYIWDEAQTDAHIELSGDVKHIAWIHYDGTHRETDYIIPTQNQCKNCHLQNGSLSPIGPKVRNLNRNISTPTGVVNQLTFLSKEGLLRSVPAIATCPRLCDYLDTSAPINDRARAYMEINCAHCHNPNGSAYTSGLYLNYENDNPHALGIDKTPVDAGRGTGGFNRDIMPSQPTRSIAIYRMKANEEGVRMPPLGRTIVHQEGVDILTRWIEAMNKEAYQ